MPASVGSNSDAISSLRRVVLASNGYADGNAEAIAQYLISRKVEMLCVVKHPLERNPKPFHQIEIYRHGELAETKRWTPPCKPPLTYIFDMFYPPLRAIPKADVWIGFGSLNALRGLQSKLMRRSIRVIYNCVDFSPERFGKSFLTKVYDAIDWLCCIYSDLIWPISAASHDARIQKHKFREPLPHYTVPMGAWLDRVPKASISGFSDHRIVFLGHLLEKQGLQAVIESLPMVRKAVPNASLHIIGGGPFMDNLRRLANDFEVGDCVVFHGFVASHEEVEAILATAAVAVATYIPEQADFTKFADPGKLKAYMGAGLPIVLTEVSPNSREIADIGGGELVTYHPEMIAEKLINILTTPSDWQRRSDMALGYMRQFDWNVILDCAFTHFFKKFGTFK